VSTLEASVTLEDVFSVVEAKRVPLAPELAGYLTLEVADGTQASGGEVDPRTVYISEEGTVALVRPKSNAPTGDAETSVRSILAKLLDASGSATPALSASAKRKPGAGLPALVQELEAALIPVNRAAGRRALARLAREVKRVTLGVGRNASARPIARPAPQVVAKRIESPEDVMSGPDAPPGPRASFSDEPATANRMQALAELAMQMNAPELLAGLTPPVPAAGTAAPRRPGSDPAVLPIVLPGGLPPGGGSPGGVAPVGPAVPSLGLTPPPHPGAPAAADPDATPGFPTPVPASIELSPPVLPALPALGSAGLPAPGLPAPALAPPAGRPLAPPARGAIGAAKPGGPPRKPGQPGETAKAGAKGTVDPLFAGDEVDSLLATFEVSNAGEKQVRTDLKAIAGLDPTPPPPDAQTIAELTKDIGKSLRRHAGDGDGGAAGDGVEDLLALADASVPLRSLDAPILPPASVSSAVLARPGYPGPGGRPPGTGRSDPASILASPPAGAVVPPAHLREPAAPVLPVVPPSEPALPRPPSWGGPSAAGTDPADRDRPERVEDRSASQRRPARPPTPGSGRQTARDPGASQRREKADPPPSTERGRRTKGGPSSGRGERPRAPRTALFMLVLALLVLVAGAVAIYMKVPTFFTGRKRPPTATSASATAVTPPAPRCKVALVVSDVPANAEILLRMGQAPLDAERMPVGARLEFVATAEGNAPRRAVVRADASWDKAADGKLRIDVPIQLDPSKAKPGALDPWPAAEPGSQVGGSGSPGTVHVVSNVRGAEVWLLAGLGPEARIEQLKCEGDIDVLLAGPPQLRKRLHVSDKDIQAATPDAQGNRVVTVSAK